MFMMTMMMMGEERRGKGVTLRRNGIRGGGLWSKRRHRNGDRNGYNLNGDKPKQHLRNSSSDAYIIDRRLYTYRMVCNCKVI